MVGNRGVIYVCVLGFGIKSLSGELIPKT